MPYSVTVIQWTYKKNLNNVYPLKILVVVDGRPTPIQTSHRVSVAQWDKDMRQVVNHPNAASINADLRRLVVEKEAELLLASRAGEALTKDLVKGKKRDGSFVKFAQEIAKKNKVVKRDSSGAEVETEEIDATWTKEINRIIEFRGSGVMLNEVNVTFLRKFNEYEMNRGMAQNTRNTTFKWLRKVIKKAKAEKLIRENPFDDYDIPRYLQADTVYLVEEEKAALAALMDDDLPHPLYLTLCYYLGSCYCGFRQSDWHKIAEPERVYNDFFRIRPEKRSVGFVVLPVGPSLTDILNRIYKLNAPPFSLTKSNLYLKALFAMARVTIKGRTYLGIKKKASSHSGRHSFGYLCASLGLPKSTTAELMGVTVQTVEVYYHLTGENIIKQAAALKSV